MAFVTGREDSGQGEPSPVSQPSTPLRTSTEIGQERAWAPPPGGSGPRYGAGPSSPPGPQPGPQPAPTAQTPQQQVASANTGISNQFFNPQRRQAIGAFLE